MQENGEKTQMKFKIGNFMLCYIYFHFFRHSSYSSSNNIINRSIQWISFKSGKLKNHLTIRCTVLLRLRVATFLFLFVGTRNFRGEVVCSNRERWFVPIALRAKRNHRRKIECISGSDGIRSSRRRHMINWKHFKCQHV